MLPNIGGHGIQVADPPELTLSKLTPFDLYFDKLAYDDVDGCLYWTNLLTTDPLNRASISAKYDIRMYAEGQKNWTIFSAEQESRFYRNNCALCI